MWIFCFGRSRISWISLSCWKLSASHRGSKRLLEDLLATFHFCLYYLHEVMYMKSLHWLQSTETYILLHFPVPTSPDTQDKKNTFSLPGLLCPNLINWNYHFSGLSGFLYGLESSTHQLYHTSEQLPKCLNKSLLLLNCSKEKHQQIQTTSYIPHSWNYYKSCLNLTRVYLVNHNIMSRTFSFLIYYSRHLILLHGSKWQKGGKQL